MIDKVYSFMWIHLFDPHHWKLSERIPGEEVSAVRAGTELTDGELYDYLAELHGLPNPAAGEPFELEWESARKLRTPTRRDYLDFIDNYDGLIRYADRQLARVYAAVEEMGFEDTLWIEKHVISFPVSHDYGINEMEHICHHVDEWKRENVK